MNFYLSHKTLTRIFAMLFSRSLLPKCGLTKCLCGKKHSLINYEFHSYPGVICLRISLSDFRTTAFVNNTCVFLLYESYFISVKFGGAVLLAPWFSQGAFDDRIKFCFYSLRFIFCILLFKKSVFSKINISRTVSGMFTNTIYYFESVRKLYHNYIITLRTGQTFLGSNVSWFVHVQETWLGNNVS